MSEIIKEVLSEIVPRTERRQKIIETADKILKKAKKIAPGILLRPSSIINMGNLYR